MLPSASQPELTIPIKPEKIATKKHNISAPAKAGIITLTRTMEAINSTIARMKEKRILVFLILKGKMFPLSI
jgi:hypothetical protein